jgi:pSer/pThr/pTyr-binding forkhead associated (FHA) protein
MRSPATESYLLTIHHESGSQTVALDAATYSLGRDSKNAIMINAKAISREHALLLRMPNSGAGTYRYRLIDGNSAGKPSMNGFTVNGQRCSVHDLHDGDEILLGGTVRMSYQVQRIVQPVQGKYQYYVVSTAVPKAEYQPIKAEPTDPNATIVGLTYKSVATEPAPVESKVIVGSSDDDEMLTALNTEF